MFRKKSLFAIILFLFTGMGVLFANSEDLSASYAEIDDIIETGSPDKLNDFLISSKDDVHYKIYESYILKKIRYLVIKEQYDLAKTEILVVIDNDLDNDDAINLYSVIDDALTEEKKRQEEAQRRQAVLAEQERKSKEAAKQIVDKEYNGVKTVSGKTVYLDPSEQRYSTIGWSGAFGMASFSFISVPEMDYNSGRYGLSGDYGLKYQTDNFILGFNLHGETSLVALYGGDESVLGTISIVPETALPALSKKLFFRFGGAGYFVNKDPSVDVLSDTFFTPIIGLKVAGITAGPFDLSAYYDYFPGHLFYNDLKTAMEAGMNFSFVITQIEQISVNFNLGLKDTLFLRNEGIENRARLLFALGVRNDAY